MDVIKLIQIKREKNEINPSSGFTLVEVSVAVAIVALISTVVLTNYRGFDSSVVLTNLAHDVALSIREAQVFGISVRGEGSGFDSGYGVHFDTDSSSTYTLFGDITTGGGYDGSDTEVDLYTFDQRYGIDSLYEIESDGSYTPISDSLDIVFTRPDPEPTFFVNGSERAMTGIRVTIASPDGSTRSVEVFSTGQISVVYD